MGQKERENNKRNYLICLMKSIFFSLLFMLFLGAIFLGEMLRVYYMRSAVFLKTMGYALILLPFSGGKQGGFVGERIKPLATVG